MDEQERVVDRNDLSELAELLEPIARLWELILGQLPEFPHDQIEKISANVTKQREDPKNCFIRGLEKLCDSKKSVTYGDIAAIMERPMLPNIPLARRIRRDYKGQYNRIVSPEEVRPLVENYLHEMAASWKMFLRQLRMPGSEVDQIEGFSDYSISCLTAGLEFWVKHANAPTYKQIARVLRGNVVTNYPLARKVEEFAKNKCQVLLPPIQRCKVQGCNKPRYKEQDGTEHEFCGRSHAVQYKRQQAQGSSAEVSHTDHTPPSPRWPGRTRPVGNVMDQTPLNREVANGFKWTNKQGAEKIFKPTEMFSDKWEDLGKQFGYAPAVLRVYDKECLGKNEGCFKKVIDRWLEDGSDNYGQTWSGLCEALKDVGGVSKYVTDFEYALRNMHTIPVPREEESSQDEIDVAALEEAAKKGSIRIKSRNILITGAGGVGKTCTMSVMIGKDPSEEKYTSTGPSTSAMRIGSIPELLVGDVLSGVNFKLLKGNTLLRLIARGVQNCKQSSKRPAIKQSGSEVCREATESGELKGSEQHDVAAIALAKNVLSSVTEIIKEHPTLQPIAVVELLHIIDSGGQLQFHEIINKFVTNLHATLYVTDIRQDPEENVMDQFYVKDEPTGKPYRSHYTHEQLFKRSLQALQLEKRSAKLAVAATHIDKIGEDEVDEAIEKKKKWVLNITKTAGISDKVIPCGDSFQDVVFPFCAHNLSKSKTPVRNLLKRLCDDKDVPFDDNEIPMRHFLLEQTMQEHSEKSRGIVSVTKCHQIGLELEMSFEKVEEALQYLSNHNLILYVPEVINHLVFCEVQTPLSAVKQIVQYSAKVRADSEVKDLSDANLKPMELFSLATHGTLTEELLKRDEFKNQFPDDADFTSSDFLKLMMHFKIIAEMCSRSSIEYFMPCILRELPEHDLKEVRMQVHESDSTEPLLLYFSKWPQAGVFCTLVTLLISKYGWQPIPFKAGGAAVECLYRNCIKFEVITASKLSCDITLIESYDSGYFEVHIELPKGESPDVLCPLVRDMLLNSLSEEVQPRDAFVCTCKITPPHAAELQKYLKCTKGNQKEKLKNDDKRLIWFGRTELIGPPATGSSSISCCISSEDVHDLLTLLSPLAGSWELFLRQLIPKHEVEAISARRQGGGIPKGPLLCLSDGLDYLVDSGDSHAYDRIINILCGCLFSNADLGRKVEEFAKSKL